MRYPGAALVLLCLMYVTGCASAPERPPYRLPDRACWHPAGAPRAIAVGVHGLNDYHEAFADIAPQLTAAGIEVCSYDQPGFGNTPQRGEWAGQGVLVDRFVRFVSTLAAKPHRPPIYVIAESMGGAVVIEALAKHPQLPVAGLILSAPAVMGDGSDNISPFGRWLVHIGALLLPDLALDRSDSPALTDDPAVARRVAGDPMIIHRTRLPVLDGLLRLMHTARLDVTRVTVPTLLLSGRQDPLVPPRTISYLAGHLAGPVRQVQFRSGRHMLLRGSRAAITARPIIAWLDARFAAAGENRTESAHGEAAGPPRDFAANEPLKAGR